MKKTITLSILTIVAAVVITTANLLADEREDEHRGRDHGEGGRKSSSYLSDPRHPLYKSECGDCHMAYPAAMLPAASWSGMMDNLADHFGDNAELDAPTAAQITAYLSANAASKGRGEYGERSWRATRGRTPPMRITQTDYFRGQHHEIPARLVKGNAQVGSFARCEACHRGAEQGDFDEHGVRIPGHGRWDD